MQKTMALKVYANKAAKQNQGLICKTFSNDQILAQ